MSHRDAVLNLLADGVRHSGTEIGLRTGISRAAVHKIVRQLRADGIEVECARGRGYRLDVHFTPLSLERMWSAVTPPVPVSLLPEVDSTNRHLLRLADAGEDVAGRACLAEAQRAGAGRRGRRWVASPYSNIMLSLAWRFEAGAARLGGLSLVAGVAVRSVLARAGIDGVALKWPNDLVWDGRKLGGILIEMRSEAGGPALAVCGVGLNVYIGPREAPLIDQAWIDLAQMGVPQVDRNWLAAHLVRALADAFQDFERHGFEQWQRSWEQHHRDAGRPVQVTDAAGRVQDGIALGVDAQGGLRLQQADGRIMTVYSGEVTLRHGPAG